MFKMPIKSITTIMISLFNWSFFLNPNNNIVDYSFSKKYQTLQVKNKIGIKYSKPEDEFSRNLKRCKPEFYIDMKGFRLYYLEDEKKINQISIEEYVFKDTIAAEKSYKEAYDYAEDTRKLARSKYGYQCWNMPDPQVYYASKDGSHVYLYTMYYNFIYHSGDESVETNIQNDKRILLDDIYREMTGSKL